MLGDPHAAAGDSHRQSASDPNGQIHINQETLHSGEAETALTLLHEAVHIVWDTEDSDLAESTARQCLRYF